MKLLDDIVRSVIEQTSKYLEYTHSQRERVKVSHQKDSQSECTIDDFKITNITKPVFSLSWIKKLKDHLQSCDMFSQVDVRIFISCTKQQNFYNLINDIKEKGFPKLASSCHIFHFKLPSHGPNPAIHFLWKQPMDDDSNSEQQFMLVNNLRAKAKTFYNRAGRKEVKQCLHRLGMVKPHVAEYLIRTILHDSSEANDKSQKAILERLDRVVSLGEDIVVDLRENNGSTPKYDSFWDIVEKKISNKTTIDDRRHNTVDEKGNEVTNTALAL